MGWGRPEAEAKRRAAETMLCDSTLGLAEIGRRLRISRSTLYRWNAQLVTHALGRGASRRRVPTPAALDAALRIHVGRQIADLDARLTRREPGLDPDRALRSLQGLRRLIDDLAAPRGTPVAEGSDAGQPQGGAHPAGATAGGVGASHGGDGADGLAPGGDDLAALRACIARRYAAFEQAGAAAGLPGEPAGPAPAAPPD